MRLPPTPPAGVVWETVWAGEIPTEHSIEGSDAKSVTVYRVRRAG